MTAGAEGGVVKDWLLNHIPESLMTFLLALLGWWVQRKIARSDALEARVQALERDKVTKENIEELRESLERTITHSNARVEARTDEILLHLAARRRDR